MNDWEHIANKRKYRKLGGKVVKNSCLGVVGTSVAAFGISVAGGIKQKPHDVAQ